ncbi:MAG: PorP/SprF family type IX secretion system membrane protein [Bacteroidetes bacterium]|nr:PorP/SprF family type IX secretion system membrane protein [Bacteroidota bacterium]
MQNKNRYIISKVFKINLMILALLVLHVGVAIGQKPQFTQFYASPLYLAPSFTGATDGSRAALNYRNQWPEIPGAFVTYAFSLDHFFHNYNSGLGLFILRDEAGSARLGNTTAGILYSYVFNADHRWTMRPGIHLNYTQQTIDYSRLIFGDQLSIDGNHSPNSLITLPPMENVAYFDASFSWLAYTSDIWIGITADHLMMPNQSLTGQNDRIPLKFSLFGGYKWLLSGTYAGIEEESISTAFLYKNQGSFNQLDIGVYWFKYPFSLGLLYRGIPIFNNPVYGIANNDAVAIIGGLRTKNLRIGYSYDFTISRLMTSTGGAHEISLIYHFNQGAPVKKPGKIPCPANQF